MKGLILFLGIVFLSERKKKQSKVGMVQNIVTGGQTRVFNNIKDASDFAATSDFTGGAFQNEITVLNDGYAISPELADKANIPNFVHTKGDLKKALSSLKRVDGSLVYVERFDEINTRTPALSDKELLNWVWSELIDDRGVDSEEDACIRTLYDIATGVKFYWNDKKSAGGAVLSGGIESHLFGGGAKLEKKTYSSIIAKKGERGNYPDTYAETITQQGADDYYALNGVLDALRDAPTPKLAIQALKTIYYGTMQNDELNMPVEYNDRSYSDTTQDDPPF